jgi:hypothetical protein
MITNLIKKTAAEWATENPVLAEGTMGLDLTSNTYRIGNGQSKWLDLGNNLPVQDTSENFNPSIGIKLDGTKYYNKYTQSGAFTISINSDSIIGGVAILPVLLDGNTITISGATKRTTSSDAVTTSGETDEYVFFETTTGTYYVINNLGVL